MQQLDWWVPFGAAAIGALLGAVGPILAVYFQGKQAARERLTRIAVEAARYDHETYVKLIMDMKQSGKVLPLYVHILFYLRLLEHVQKGGDLTDDFLAQLAKRNEELAKKVPSMKRLTRED